MAAWSGAVHVGAPVKQPAAPHTAGIVKQQRPVNGVVFSACLSVISGTTKCPMSGEPRPGNDPPMSQPGLADLDQAPAEHSQDAAVGLGAHGWPHVWLGATAENMVEARRQIPILLQGPTRVHWLSVAPLLEPLDLRPWLGRGIDWIVVGGETGARGARYMEPDWARDLRDQCRDTGAALFLKQMWKRQAIPADLMVREYPACFDRLVIGDRTARAHRLPSSHLGGDTLADHLHVSRLPFDGDRAHAPLRRSNSACSAPTEQIEQQPAGLSSNVQNSCQDGERLW